MKWTVSRPDLSLNADVPHATLFPRQRAAG